ncbi:hypothetical protein [Riemerella anatipestifer]|uniref:hypothetical protein n=1 Tax=Riemerella anatipestifer TaxID=34085 RepID=UPI0027A30FCE|nr:hypothetical protein [Riemerella anatipestifer]WIR86160.1 hypothetical protein CRP12_000029 [Riemerella phage vB_RanS_CRP12]
MGNLEKSKNINEIIESTSFREEIEGAIKSGIFTDYAYDGEDEYPVDEFDSIFALDTVIKVIKKYFCMEEKADCKVNGVEIKGRPIINKETKNVLDRLELHGIEKVTLLDSEGNSQQLIDTEKDLFICKPPENN